MERATIDLMSSCASCQIQLGSEAILFAGGLYCCTGCAEGGPCICTYEHDLGRYPPSSYAKPVTLTELLDRYEGPDPA
jgi:hypothetical protein